MPRLQRHPLLAIAVLIFVTGPPAPAAAESARDREAAARRYSACLRLAHERPAKALTRARTWHDTGGGDPARHCEGVALMRLDRHAEAGKLLENLAKTLAKGRGPAMRAKALAQAGQAWILAGRPARAEAAYTAAIDLRGADAGLWIDRALARFEMGDYWKAIDDLNRASELAPGRADVLVFRASAYRHVDAPTMAESDIKQALRRDPDNPEGLLEKGILRRLDGDRKGARRAWLRVIEVAPESPAAESARKNLARLDMKGVRPLEGAAANDGA